MKRAGANIMGSGVNSFALWCDNCGAVVVHACDFGKKLQDMRLNGTWNRFKTCIQNA